MPRHHRSRYDDSYSSKSSDSDDSRLKSKHKRSSRSSSRSRHSSKRQRSYSRSSSRHSPVRRRDYKSKDKDRSHKRRSNSKSSKSSRTRTKHKTSSKKSSSRRSSPSSSSRSSSSDRPVVKPAIVAHLKNKKNEDKEKIEKAIKAAEAAGLTMCKLPSYEYKEVEVKEDMPTIQDRNVLNELNSESFVQKQFTSTRNSKKIPENIVIDLNAETIKIPVDMEIPKTDPLFHEQFFQDEQSLKDKWLKELLTYRRRAMRGET